MRVLCSRTHAIHRGPTRPACGGPPCMPITEACSARYPGARLCYPWSCSTGDGPLRPLSLLTMYVKLGIGEGVCLTDRGLLIGAEFNGSWPHTGARSLSRLPSSRPRPCHPSISCSKNLPLWSEGSGREPRAHSVRHQAQQPNESSPSSRRRSLSKQHRSWPAVRLVACSESSAQERFSWHR